MTILPNLRFSRWKSYITNNYKNLAAKLSLMYYLDG